MTGCNDKVYSYEGKVISGNQIGRKLGIPTINIPTSELANLPVYGVYVAKVLLLDSNDSYNGVANIGIKPTIESTDGDNPVCIEVNLFDFAGDLYDADIRVELLEFVREEKKFDSLDDLKSQIERDILTARKYFEDKRK